MEAEVLNFIIFIFEIFFFKGDFSFDALFGNLVNDLLPSFQEEEANSSDANDVFPNGTIRGPSDVAKLAPLFPEVDALLSLFKDSCRELVDLRQQVFF